MRKNIVAGNWKMNKTLQEGIALATELNEALTADKPNCEVIICTPFIHLASVTPIVDKGIIAVGAENCAVIEAGTSGGNYYLFQVLSDALYNFKVKKISIDDTIPLSDHTWQTSDWRIFMNTFSGNYRDYNVGIRQPIGGSNYCYAWIRLNFYYDQVVEKYKVSLYDMAYCTVPNYPLRVGQKSFDDTSISDTSESKDYVLFPSPANDKITLKFNNHYYNTTDNEIKIYGIDGRLLKTQNSDFDNIDVSNLSSGVYIMKIYLGNEENYTEKFVKN